MSKSPTLSSPKTHATIVIKLGESYKANLSLLFESPQDDAHMELNLRIPAPIWLIV